MFAISLAVPLSFITSPIAAQSFSNEMVTIPSGTATLGMSEDHFAAPPPFNAPLHSVSLSAFAMSACEVTNEQYVDFLNGALGAGLVEVRQETARGPDEGFLLVYGTTAAPTDYRERAMLNLSGTRVMKDHDNADGDGDPFTGAIEPENPLNIIYIGYDEARPVGERFYVKDPRNPNDFDWRALTDYHNYTNETRRLDMSETLNDYDAWPELADFPANMPTVEDVAEWPATFVRWYGAKAFALYFGLDLPTEAEWEFAAQGGAEFLYATDDGTLRGDGTSAVWNHEGANPALGHVQHVKTGRPNPFGLYNMAGNVWEWVDDWYAADFYADGTDPLNETDTGLKVRRGGSWNYHQFTLGTASRAYDEQFKGNDHFGFRVVDRDVATAIQSTAREESSVFTASAFIDLNYPNPFNSATTIRYYVGGTGLVQLDIYSLGGQRVRSLVLVALEPGFYEVAWDGMDEQRHAVASGMYLARLRTERDVEVRKMTLIK